MTRQYDNQNGSFSMPRCFEHLQKESKLEVLSAFSKKEKYQTLRFMFFTRPGPRTYTQALDIGLSLEELIGVYLLLANKNASPLKLQRPGKSLTIEPANDAKPGMYLGALSSSRPGSVMDNQVSINLPPYKCIYLSGIVLSCIASNMGCDTATTNNLINRWN